MFVEIPSDVPEASRQDGEAAEAKAFGRIVRGGSGAFSDNTERALRSDRAARPRRPPTDCVRFTESPRSVPGAGSKESVPDRPRARMSAVSARAGPPAIRPGMPVADRQAAVS